MHNIAYTRAEEKRDQLRLQLAGMNRHSGGGRMDVKARTMKFSSLDPDIASRYDDFDDEESTSLRSKRAMYRQRDAPGRVQKSIIERHIGGNHPSQPQIRVHSHTSSHRRDLIYEITVKNASRSGKNILLKMLADSVERFLPLSPRMDSNGDLRFMILSEDDAEALCSMSRRIADVQNPSVKYAIFKKRTSAPFEGLSNNSRAIIQEILKTRYNRLANSLDLSSFQSDPFFEAQKETPRGLIHNSVMVVVADYVSKHFGNIKGLRLNNNNLRTLDFVAALTFAAPNVTELDLANNAISRIDELTKLSGWQLESAHFENNEFTMGFHDNFSAYSNAIHEQFPLITYLDGIGVNAVASREAVNSSQSIPKFNTGYCTDESLRKMIENFLVEFYGFYDGPNPEQSRQQLINAYDTNATFSYSICVLPDTKFLQPEDPELYHLYVRNSHNIVVQPRWQSFRDRLLFRGSMEIAVALSKLPMTEHVKQSFLLDFNFVTNKLTVVTLQGIFKDGKPQVDGSGGSLIKSGKECKFFIRQFTIVAKSEGLAILSDILQITPVSTLRMEHYNNLLKSASVQAQRQLDGMAPPPPSPQQQILQMAAASAAAGTYSAAMLGGAFVKTEPPLLQQQQQSPILLGALAAAPTSSSLTTAATPSIFGTNEASSHAEMVKQFSAFSGMRPEWSEKCLQDCSWSWEDAKRAFTNIRNQIPPDAFP